MAEDAVHDYGPKSLLADMPRVDYLATAEDIGALESQMKGLAPEVRLRRLLELKQALLGQALPQILREPVPRETGSDVGYWPAFMRAGVGKFADAVTGIPDAIKNTVSNVGINEIKSQSANVIPFTQQQQDIAGQIQNLSGPALSERTLPFVPNGADVLAAGDRLGEVAAAAKNLDFGQFSKNPNAATPMESLMNTEGSRLRTESMAQDHPVATAMGSAAGDIATLLTVRSPFAKGRNAAALSREVSALAPEKLTTLGNDLMVAPEVRKQALSILADKANQSQADLKFIGEVPDFLQVMTQRAGGWKGMMKAAGRPAEAGLEGAVLGVLTDGDPSQTAAYSAGAQAAGSVGLTFLSGMTSGKLSPMQNFGINFSLAALATAGVYQAIKEVAPGGPNSPMESLKAGYSKTALAVGAGLLSGLAGMGRLPAAAFPKIADAISAVPRSAVISVINDMTSDTRVERVVQKVAADPEYFGPSAARRLDRAFRNPHISISGVVDDLMMQKDFAEKYRALEK